MIVVTKAIEKLSNKLKVNIQKETPLIRFQFEEYTKKRRRRWEEKSFSNLLLLLLMFWPKFLFLLFSFTRREEKKIQTCLSIRRIANVQCRNKISRFEIIVRFLGCSLDCQNYVNSLSIGRKLHWQQCLHLNKFLVEMNRKCLLYFGKSNDCTSTA